ncbi:hypothetical protein BKA62DRAFT_315488 [Auriculariales sp. MPI-PUGE-AT-0066]|nr:hypothetical protein BKA62DRAFT_315488 [Auriculariales sp. MPI-PUGE-AT-0066]
MRAVSTLLAALAGASAVFASADADVHNLAARNCARMPSGPDSDVRDEIYRVALGMKVNAKVMLAMMATAITETWVNNLNCGDKDSLGVFQQRPSQGWGSAEQLMNIDYSTKKYLDLCIQLDKQFPGIDAGVLAQKVQRAEAGNQYTKNLDLARHYLDLAEASVGQAGPKPTSDPDPEPSTPTKTPTTPTKTPTGTKTNTKPSTPTATTAPPKTDPNSLPNPAPPLRTLVDADGTVMKVLVMPSGIVGRVSPEKDGSKKAADRAKAGACARAEYPRVGDGCTTFATRYGLKLAAFQDLNPALDEECSNLTAQVAWCVEAAKVLDNA